MNKFEGSETNALADTTPPPETPPIFGAVPEFPFEAAPERLVLSSEAHSRLSETGSFVDFNGEFASESLGNGRLVIREVASGEVRVQADVLRDGSPSVHLDARVRESWVVRAAAAHPTSAGASVVRELFRLAEIPHQSTVRVSVAAD